MVPRGFSKNGKRASNYISLQNSLFFYHTMEKSLSFFLYFIKFSEILTFKPLKKQISAMLPLFISSIFDHQLFLPGTIKMENAPASRFLIGLFQKFDIA